jgi:hypothetical protein
MKATPRLGLTLPLVLALLAGCGKAGAPVSTLDSPGSNSAEQSAVASEMAMNPTLVDDGMSESSDQTAAEPAAGSVGAMGMRSAGAMTAIQPAFWWRTINHVERSFEFAFADTDATGLPTTAIVIVHKRLSGTFNILVRDPGSEGTPNEGHVVAKPLADHWVRRLLLKRILRPEADPLSRGWRIVAASGVKVTARDAETRIESLRVQSTGLDTTITDVLAFQRLRRILKVDPETDVTLTVTTLRNDDVVAFYAFDRRFRMRNNGDNTYSATFQSPQFAGIRHFGVNALSNGTVFDDAARYDSQAWILPYIVKPTELADATVR